MDQPDKNDEERRIAEVMQIAESLAVGERQPGEVHNGYTRLGSATHGAFRFKWVAHELEEGRYVVDETIGSSTVAVRSRLLPKSDVLPYIDERQRLHFQKVEEIRREWTAGIKAPEQQAAQPVAENAAEPGPPEAAARDHVEMYDEIRRMLREQK
jgi:hypothetical protein